MTSSHAIPELLSRITSGVYVIGVAAQDQYNAFTASWVMQISFNPALITLSINPENRSYEFLCKCPVFTVNVLATGQIPLVSHFGQSSRKVDKLATVAWRKSSQGVPVLPEALAYLECTLLQDILAGDHHLLIARVDGGEILSPSASPMLYQETGSIDGSSTLY
jgi:flavin reductase (DIM6/NTAB) family NADH-FMN oxidoreductase RutF